MKYVVIIPAHNEAHYLPGLLDSLMAQSHLPDQIVLINDASADNTEAIMQDYTNKYARINYINRPSAKTHQPGAKVVDAFKEGLQSIKTPYDILVKLDADLLLPNDYFKVLLNVFKDPKVGIAGGFCYEQNEKGEWEKNHPMHNDHVRGAFKAYKKECYDQIGGLASAMGWDTLDELLARHKGFSVLSLEQLKVKHLRPLGSAYSSPKVARLQGQAFYRMRYGFFIGFLAMSKHAWNKRSAPIFLGLLIGFFSAFLGRSSFLVNPTEGTFIRKYRWNQIRFKKD